MTETCRRPVSSALVNGSILGRHHATRPHPSRTSHRSAARSTRRRGRCRAAPRRLATQRVHEPPRLRFVARVQREIDLGDRETAVDRRGRVAAADRANHPLGHRGDEQQRDAAAYLPGHQIPVQAPFRRRGGEAGPSAGTHVGPRRLQRRPHAEDEQREQQRDGRIRRAPSTLTSGTAATWSARGPSAARW